MTNLAEFQPTRPLRGATLSGKKYIQVIGISTHAPLAGRDGTFMVVSGVHEDFNPRAPCGARPSNAVLTRQRGQDFNPRAPCGARQGGVGRAETLLQISTHAPLAGRDTPSSRTARCASYFNPRAPCGARQARHPAAAGAFTISTHAPLAGRDGRWYEGSLHPNQISTHAPLAGRDSKSVQITMHIFAITDKFQMLLHRMPPVRAFCSFLMQENHADFGCEPPK